MSATGREESELVLAYADPNTSERMPDGFVWTVTLVWAVGSLVELVSVFVIIGVVALRRGYTFDRSDWVDDFIPTAAILGVLVGLLVSRRTRCVTGSRIVLISCALVAASAVASILIWTWDVLPKVVSGNGPPGTAVTWESELILGRLLPVVWPALVVMFAWRGNPTRRSAGRILVCWAVGGLFFSACTTTNLYQLSGLTYLRPEFWGNTVLPPWTVLFALILVVGLVIWLGPSRKYIGGALFLIGAGASLCIGLLHAWYDERLAGVRHWQFQAFYQPGNLADVAAEIISALLLWQIAPLALLLFARKHAEGNGLHRL
jgi:hypothetical protein